MRIGLANLRGRVTCKVDILGSEETDIACRTLNDHQGTPLLPFSSRECGTAQHSLNVTQVFAVSS